MKKKTFHLTIVFSLLIFITFNKQTNIFSHDLEIEAATESWRRGPQRVTSEGEVCGERRGEVGFPTRTMESDERRWVGEVCERLGEVGRRRAAREGGSVAKFDGRCVRSERRVEMGRR